MKKIRILGFDYTISVEKNTEAVEGRMGLTDFERQIIYINEELTPEMQVSTLLHEILEALNFHFELGLKHKQISCIEAGFFSTLSDNDWNLDYVLTSPEEEVVHEW